MPAISAPPQVQVVVVWDMPFAAASSRPAGMSALLFHDESSRKSAQEAAQALRRFRGRFIDEMGTVAVPQACLLNPLTAQDNLRNFAEANGVDLEQLAEGAGRHFVSPAINRRTNPLTEEELEFLFEDDQRAFDR